MEGCTLVLKIKKIFLFSLLCLTVILSGCSLLFPSMENLPTGDLLNSYPSPNGENLINVYLCDGGATVDFAIRGEVVRLDGTKKNIYWEYHCDQADVEWLSDDTVVINDQTLNIYTDVYDWRKEP